MRTEIGALLYAVYYFNGIGLMFVCHQRKFASRTLSGETVQRKRTAKPPLVRCQENRTLTPPMKSRAAAALSAAGSCK